MSRNRFEAILSNLYLADNEAADKINRLYKIAEFMEKFNGNCQNAYRPGKDACIDESLVPFRGRIVFRQYIPNKRHRYGTKIFKLCSKGEYTYSMSIYSGREHQPRTVSVAESVVVGLMENLLNGGRTLYTDNWYTSISLAQALLSRKTDLVGTMRKDRKRVPKCVADGRLQRGNVVAMQNQQGILALKWRDKRDVLMLSTVHDAAVNDEGKPLVVVDYNADKTFIDISDQMASYSPFIRKTTKWYLRIFYTPSARLQWSMHGTFTTLTSRRKLV